MRFDLDLFSFRIGTHSFTNNNITECCTDISFVSLLNVK